MNSPWASIATQIATEASGASGRGHILCVDTIGSEID